MNHQAQPAITAPWGLAPERESWSPGDGVVFAGMALMEVTPDGVIATVNDGLCALLGRPRDQLIGLRPLDFTHPADRAATVHHLATLHAIPATGRTVVEKRYLRGDGTSVWVRVTAAWNPHGDRVLSHVADINDLVAARDAALTAQRRLHAIMNHSADLIAVFDAAGTVVNANPAAASMLAPLADGKSVPALVRLVTHPDDADRFLSWLSGVHVVPGLHPAVRFRVTAPDEGWTYLEVDANNLLDDASVGGIVVMARDVTDETEQMRKVEGAKAALVGALARSTEFRDPYTAGHQLKVAELSRAIAERLGMSDCEIADIALGASLHDIGKIAIPAEILTRPGRLSPIEFELVKTHSRVGHEILTDVDLPTSVTDIVLRHHERLDGSGYPDGLGGADLDLPVRIVAVADVLDAVASHRPYRASLGMAAAREVVGKDVGRLYDPDVVAAAFAVTAE